MRKIIADFNLWMDIKKLMEDEERIKKGDILKEIPNIDYLLIDGWDIPSLLEIAKFKW